MGHIEKKAKKRDIISFLTTILIIIALVIAGPVNAVNIKLDTDKAVYSVEDGKIKFTTAVDIQRNERVPIKRLKLIINDGDKICEFLPDGTNSCPNIQITLINSGQETEGDRIGDGFGYINPGDEPEKQETNFSFGYGFEDETRKSGFNGELKYEIEWDFVADGADGGKYQAILEAYAEDTTANYTYTSKKPTSFHIKPQKKYIITDKATIKADDGTINYIGSLIGFDEEDNMFLAQLARSTTNGESIVTGRTSLNVYGEKDDSTKVRLNIRMKDKEYELVEFTKDKIELTGEAEFEYSKTKQGIWLNGTRVGYEPSEELRGTLDDISIKIENGKVVMSSTDTTLPFSVMMYITQFNYR